MDNFGQNVFSTSAPHGVSRTVSLSVPGQQVTSTAADATSNIELNNSGEKKTLARSLTQPQGTLEYLVRFRIKKNVLLNIHTK